MARAGPKNGTGQRLPPSSILDERETRERDEAEGGCCFR
jgi:hypothetical protein